VRWLAETHAFYTARMAPNRVKALGIPTAINVACALFVLAAFRMDQSVALQLTGLLARLVIVIAFLYFVQAWRKTVLAYW
jgi:hypothetical protein